MTTNEWIGEIIDVETAFLYGDLEEEIYMTIPKGFEEYLHQDLKNKCLILKNQFTDWYKWQELGGKNLHIHYKKLDLKNVHQTIA